MKLERVLFYFNIFVLFDYFPFVLRIKNLQLLDIYL